MRGAGLGACIDDAMGQQPGDVLVVFGITGDLAKVMTFADGLLSGYGGWHPPWVAS
jgi:hypothetical protein